MCAPEWNAVRSSARMSSERRGRVSCFRADRSPSWCDFSECVAQGLHRSGTLDLRPSVMPVSWSASSHLSTPTHDGEGQEFGCRVHSPSRDRPSGSPLTAAPVHDDRVVSVPQVGTRERDEQIRLVPGDDHPMSHQASFRSASHEPKRWRGSGRPISPNAAATASISTPRTRPRR